MQYNKDCTMFICAYIHELHMYFYPLSIYSFGGSSYILNTDEKLLIRKYLFFVIKTETKGCLYMKAYMT